MAITVAELAYLVDSALDVCVANETDEIFSVKIVGAQLRVGAGPQLEDVVGLGDSPDEARDDYAVKIAGRVLVVGGNPRGFSVRIPTTIVGN